MITTRLLLRPAREGPLLNFAANLSMLFNEVPFSDRFAAAARCGFKGVEYLFPYHQDRDRIAELLAKNRLAQVLYNLPAGDWDAGERGIACHPGRQGEFQDGVGRAIDYAAVLGCRQVNCLAGIRPPAVPPGEARRTLVDNLRFAAQALEKAGIRLLLEPVNTRDIPGFFVCRTAAAIDIIREVGSNNLWLQYDIYHAQVMEGDLANTINTNLQSIGHIQVADNPGRHEPGTGEINFRFLFDYVDRLAYDGWIGCEYRPITTTEAGLTWLRTLSPRQGGQASSTGDTPT